MTDERHTHHSLRSEGPSVVAIGGGHGLSATLRALRHYAGDITAVVSVADDGGSTGRLRAAMPDLPAPGDVRKCLGALASEDEPFALLLEHRFDNGELAGHTLGNLLLVALAGELGSFDGAVAELAQRVGAVGRVLPATEVPVSLEAVTASAATPIVGQVAVQNTAGVRQIRLQPPNPPTFTTPSSSFVNYTSINFYWTSGGGGGGYRYKINDANLDLGATFSNFNSFNASMAGEGTLTVYLQ